MEIINTSEMPEREGRGVVLMALGHPIYGQWAVNLAACIKKEEPEMRICLLHNDSSLTELKEIHNTLFNIKRVVPFEYAMWEDKTCYVKPKLYLPKLTPFEETLFLDVDMVWSPYKRVESVFESLKQYKFTIANRGVYEMTADSAGHSDWVDLKYIKETYDIDRWIDVASEWVYFKHCDEVVDLFETAVKYYDDPKMSTKSFAGGRPDEPALCMAMLEKDMYPHQIPYYPTYWKPLHKHKKEQEIWQNYYAMSLGGRGIDEQTRKMAYNIVKNRAWHQGIPIFPYPDKRKYLKERQLI